MRYKTIPLVLAVGVLVLPTGCSDGPMYDFAVPTSIPTMDAPSPRIPEGYFPAVWDPSIHSSGPSLYPSKKSFLQQLLKCGKTGDHGEERSEAERCDPYYTISVVESSVLTIKPYAEYSFLDTLQSSTYHMVTEVYQVLKELSRDPETALLYWTKDEDDPHPTLFKSPFLNERIRLNFVPDQATWQNLADNRARLEAVVPDDLSSPIRVKVWARGKGLIGFRVLRQSDTLPLSLRVEPQVQCNNPRVKLPKGVVCSIFWWDEARYGDRAPWSTTPVPFPLVVSPDLGFEYQSVLFRTPAWVAKERAKLKAQATVEPASEI